MQYPQLIHPVSLDDLDDVLALDQRIFGPLAYPRFVLRQFYDICQPFFLLSRDILDTINGFVIGQLDFRQGEAWILALGVAPEFRGQGIGQALSRQLIEQLEAQQAHIIRLTVSPANHAAIRLYQSLGFTEQYAEENYYGPGEDRLVLQRNLP